MGAEVVGIDGLYDTLADMGLEYGPVFQGLRAVWRRGDEVFAEVSLAEDQQRDGASSFGVHPALLDAALHASVMSIANAADGEHGRRARWGAPPVLLVGCGALRVGCFFATRVPIRDGR